jgi:hypothetical protein
VIAALATISLGAIWTSAASDFGPKGVLERFEQVEPVVVFGTDAVSYVPTFPTFLLFILFLNADFLIWVGIMESCIIICQRFKSCWRD